GGGEAPPHSPPPPPPPGGAGKGKKRAPPPPHPAEKPWFHGQQEKSKSGSPARAALISHGDAPRTQATGGRAPAGRWRQPSRCGGRGTVAAPGRRGVRGAASSRPGRLRRYYPVPRKRLTRHPATADDRQRKRDLLTCSALEGWRWPRKIHNGPARGVGVRTFAWGPSSTPARSVRVRPGSSR